MIHIANRRVLQILVRKAFDWWVLLFHVFLRIVTEVEGDVRLCDFVTSCELQDAS